MLIVSVAKNLNEWHYSNKLNKEEILWGISWIECKIDNNFWIIFIYWIHEMLIKFSIYRKPQIFKSCQFLFPVYLKKKKCKIFKIFGLLTKVPSFNSLNDNWVTETLIYSDYARN
jgi:hypothetical protein